MKRVQVFLGNTLGKFGRSLQSRRDEETRGNTDEKMPVRQCLATEDGAFSGETRLCENIRKIR